MKRIPANVAWPLVIVLLLLSNIAIAVGTLVAANLRGGVQVVPDYYSKAVAWDSLATVQYASNQLGWMAEVEADRPAETVSVFINDSASLPVEGLAVALTLSRPQKSLPIGSFELKPSEKPGEYRGSMIRFNGVGLYDLSITAAQGDNLFVDVIRLDVR